MKRLALALLAGPLAAAVAQAQAWILWGPVYSRLPERGFESAMARGIIPRNCMASIPATVVSFVILSLAAFVVLRPPGFDRILRALALLLTGTVSLFLLVFASPYLRSSNFFPLWIPFLAVGCLLSIGIAWIAVAVVERLRAIPSR